MLKKAITYTDFSGDQVTDTFYFNLSKTEILEWEAKYQEGLVKFFERIVETTDRQGLILIFKEFILKCYGQKSDDGKRFIKNDQLREEFTQTAAYDVLFMELATSDDAAALFITGVLPKDVVDGVDLKQLAAEKFGTVQSNTGEVTQKPENPPQVPAGPVPPTT